MTSINNHLYSVTDLPEHFLEVCSTNHIIDVVNNNTLRASTMFWDNLLHASKYLNNLFYLYNRLHFKREHDFVVLNLLTADEGGDMS